MYGRERKRENRCGILPQIYSDIARAMQINYPDDQLSRCAKFIYHRDSGNRKKKKKSIQNFVLLVSVIGICRRLVADVTALRHNSRNIECAWDFSRISLPLLRI